MVRCIIIPAIAASMFAEVSEVVVRIRHASLEDLVEAATRSDIVVNYIRHPPTNHLLSKYISFTTGTEYRIFADDIIFVVGLRYRTPVPGQDVAVTPDDLLILAVDILSIKK
jgi:hypothetical protein